MIQLNEETRQALLKLAQETQVYPEGNILKLFDPGDDEAFKAYLEKSMARDRAMRQRRLDITKQIQIQNRDLTKFNEQVSLLNKDLTIALEEQKKAKEQVIMALKKLEKKNQDLAQFSWMTSHNLRGPLASTLGITNLLKDYMQASADLKGLYEHLRSSVIKMDEVLADVSMLLETRDTPPIHNEQLDLGNLLLASLAKIQGTEPTISTFVSSDFSGCPSIISTRNYVEEIFQQLILNGFQYRAEERAPVIHLSSTLDGDYAEINIRDNGSGIKTEDLDKIFEPFKKLHYKSSGKGLGLYVARTQAEAMGGSLNVTSEFGVGSIFCCRLPKDGFTPGI